MTKDEEIKIRLKNRETGMPHDCIKRPKGQGYIVFGVRTIYKTKKELEGDYKIMRYD